MKKKLLKTSFLLALGEAVYISLVALFMFNATKLFSNDAGVLNIIAVLTLFVVSAAVSGYLILGKPGLCIWKEERRKAWSSLPGPSAGWLFFFSFSFPSRSIEFKLFAKI